MTASAVKRTISWNQLISFFLPLGLSATLVTLSHVIINSTLARADNPELVIASYALPLSLLGITERPAVLLRQACSTLVRDRISFRAMAAVSSYVFACIILLGLIICYTPVGEWVFLYFFGVEPELLDSTISVYRILMYVSIFSGLRCLFHGIIIFNMRTKWLTIGMGVRIVAMYLLSLYFITTDNVSSGRVGAIIFLMGMVIEALVAIWEGTSLLKKVIPEKVPGHPVETKKQIFSFYKPLLYSSIIAVIIGPSINAVLGKTTHIHLAISSFAIAGSLTQLVLSFFSYIHQIVLNFYRKDAKSVLRFVFVLSFIPGTLIAILAYTPLGPWFMSHVMGVNAELMRASLHAMRIFMIMTLVFPWLDYMNGIIMLRGQTKIMVFSQSANATITVLTLFISIWAVPNWNGMIGALAQSIGTLAELLVVVYVLKRTAEEAQPTLSPKNL
ncbi:multi antimicrobial extrusion protein MatE [Paenibacillus sp. CGMCC 1.16610]|uniref:Multi antimicrobial extrusion protein MatE n=1 Tax=Paenibacillus anseongense TaxID=2682845 RepID=A0ABW9UCA7_9BACL|nr:MULTISPECIES: multi antimicrobial extrusion protein MatE [Paenibacillus]MBA2943845.1 multi antimicrobial extrusion protein MatE [Paenibacillus sp. CGMCC 1.16610]MVQ37734.1 multi antimicrobial extrusion protein MatE [Paenibacillus anseongense]